MKINAATAAKSLQSCPTLCDPIDGSPPGSPVPGILQARILEWVHISHESEKWKWSRSVFATPWTAAYQAPPSMGFSRQEHWSGLPLPSPIGDVSCDHLVMVVSDGFLYQNVTGFLLQLMNFSWEDILRPCNILFLIMPCPLILSSTHDSCL